MSAMELDDDAFDYLDPEDLEIIVKEEEQYLSSQMQIENVITVDSSHVQEKGNNHIVTQSQSDNDDSRTIEELKYKLYLAETDNKQLEERLRNSEKSIELKEYDLVQLKKQYAKYKADLSGHSQTKRPFPGAFPQIKQKYIKSFNNSFVRDEYSRSASPSPLTQPTPIEVDQPSQSTIKLTNSDSMSDISIGSEAAQNKQGPIIQRNRVFDSHMHPKVKPVVTVNNKLLPLPKLNNEANDHLLRILFANLFKEWNKSHNNQKEFTSVLIPSRFKQFVKQFAFQFVPSEECPSTERLQMIAAEIDDIIVRSEQVDSTIRFLMIQFNACLTICLENPHNLIHIIQLISTLINDLTSYFDVTKDRLYNDLMLDMSQSTLYKLVKCFALFSFSTEFTKGYQVIEDYPDIMSINYSQIKSITEKYDVFPSAIAQAMFMKEKTSPVAHDTIKSILEILIRVGRHYQKPIFVFLLTDKGFLDLISVDTPFDLLEKVWGVLQTNFTDKNWMSTNFGRPSIADDHNVEVVIKLTDMLVKQKSLSTKDWYKVRRKTLYILNELCKVEIPSFTSKWIDKKVYMKTIDLLIDLCQFSDKSKRKDEIQDHALLIRDGFQVIYTIINKGCDGLFDEYTNYTSSKLQDLVIHYLEKVTLGQHIARSIVALVDRTLDNLMES